MLLTVTDCLLLGNSAYIGGGLYHCLSAQGCILARNIAEYGGGLSRVQSTLNTTIHDNFAYSEGGGMNYGDEVINCILWNNWPDEIGHLETLVYYSDIEGGWPGEGNIESDPLFVDPDSLDFNLLVDSPCIDTGDPGFDVPPGGGRRIDMGAYEYWHGWNIAKGMPTR